MTGAEANAHISSSESCGGWHNMTIYTSEEKCLEYRTDYIHHDAVYENVWHDPEYRTVHHAEETVSYQVWIDE